MLESPLSRYAGAIALVAGILVVASRVVLMTTPADIDALRSSSCQARSRSTASSRSRPTRCSLWPWSPSTSARRGPEHPRSCGSRCGHDRHDLYGRRLVVRGVRSPAARGDCPGRDGHLGWRSTVLGWRVQLHPLRARMGAVRGRHLARGRLPRSNCHRDSGRWPPVWGSHRFRVSGRGNDPRPGCRLGRRVDDKDGEGRRQRRRSAGSCLMATERSNCRPAGALGNVQAKG